MLIRRARWGLVVLVVRAGDVDGLMNLLLLGLNLASWVSNAFQFNKHILAYDSI